MSTGVGGDVDGTVDTHYGIRFWVALALGAACMAVGVAGFLDATPDWDRRVSFAVWLVGLDLAHDLLLAPAACLVGLAVAWRVRGPWRAPLQAGLIASACVLAVAAAPLRGTAAVAQNPTIQPLDYTTATLTVLAVVWALVIAWRVLGALRRR